MKQWIPSALLLLILCSCSTMRVETTVISGVTNPPSEMTENPFFAESRLPFQAPDFHEIRTEDFLPAFEKGMDQQMAEIEEIVSSSEAPTPENTLVALEESGEILRRVRQVFFNLTSAHTNDELQKLQAKLAPLLSEHSDNILLNQELFDRVSTLYEQRDRLDLDEETRQLLEERHRQFVRSGALLPESEQNRIRKINERLSELTTDFQEKLMEMTREQAVRVEHEEELNGLSRQQIQSAEEAARDRGYESGYLLTITNTTRQPVLANLKNRELREKIWKASSGRGTGEKSGVDTRPLVLEIVSLRAERAELLGYENWAEYAIDPQMAGGPGEVVTMFDELIPNVVANAEEEASRIGRMMEEDGIEGRVEPWDWEFYAERVRNRDYDLNETEVRNYFELERVLREGVFYTMEQLYGIRFEERNDLPVYHPDVRTFTVYNEANEPIGLFYADLFERDSKRGGAWMSSFVSQSRLLDQKPVVMNVLNIPKPPSGEPGLISFDHVTTLFHEMGHALHGLFSDVRYPGLSGTSVPRDFVEFPSTFHENWALYPDVLENIAVHHETGENIPEDLLERLRSAQKFNQGFDTQEYLAAALIDLEWHRLGMGDVPEDPLEFENEVLTEYGLDNPAIPPRYRSPYFSHIFAGGYAASYYAYMWSEVLAADAFAFMIEKGGLNRSNGDHFRQQILSRGGSREAMELYLEFRGSEPDVEHLLRRRGLYNTAD